MAKRLPKHLSEYRDNLIAREWEKVRHKFTMADMAEVFKTSPTIIYNAIKRYKAQKEN